MGETMRTIKRALLSVSDKTGIVEIAQTLVEYKCEIISTGGTKRVLQDAGIDVTDISSVTGNPEAFGGRMKTISFAIESALLFDREKDAEEAESLGIKPIDMVVCNLYPFAKVKAQGADLPTLIENIDIGGPTMVRASAKNYRYVATITDVKDYANIIAELRQYNGGLSEQTRFNLMRKAFNHTADYDALIATTMDDQAGEMSLRYHFTGGNELRYGENSHQKGWIYRDAAAEKSLYDCEFLHGKELSYNNFNDIQGAIDSVKEMGRYAVSVIKHSNPCGLAEADDQRIAMENAWAGDPISAFGSIVAFNQPVSLKTVEFFELNNEDKSKRKFVEVVVAPDFTEEALEYLKFHQNLRVIRFDPKDSCNTYDLKYLAGSLLVQDVDKEVFSKMEVKTEKTINLEAAQPLVEFGIKAMRQVKSNSIVIVRQMQDGGYQLLGMGAGQPNRLISTKLAIEKSRENLKNEYIGDDFEAYVKAVFAESILVSDAFFPFPDNIEIAAAAGIKTVIQPGGSIRDKKVIKACNECGVAMIFSGLRHFKH